ncbi:TrmH family RNA methyltransferase [Filimonas effusa]|uniref:tRNA (guanosine(18)-2'-O)-methyltransferase n=1 Tax=Filimonas effusa TaxID=2508721 RepID=A0A4Q1DCN9_9BACT|nr:RNA methyltransferase [Filimonas effusa]RXK86309.1 RNA methyltransferase [Filimonas effusa]
MTSERQEKLERVLHKRQSALTVVLENIEDPRNISAVMRSCDAVGIQDVYVINDRPVRERNWGFKSGRSAEKWVSLHYFDSVAACVQELRQHYRQILTTRLSEDAVSVYQVDFTIPTALVFGNERKGVSDEMSALADGNIIIPMAGMLQSLNISVACAVCIYEAYRQKQLAGHYDSPGLPEMRREELWKEWKAWSADENGLRTHQ